MRGGLFFRPIAGRGRTGDECGGRPSLHPCARARNVLRNGSRSGGERKCGRLRCNRARFGRVLLYSRNRLCRPMQQRLGQSRMPGKKRPQQRKGFKTNEFIVYPAHGVGRIVSIEEEEIAGATLELFVITFEQDKMTLRVPTTKLETVGMRKLSEDKIVKKALDTLKGKARVKRTMWSRRAQEYEAKINSGDLVSIAEVVRDLYRSETQPEQSYSERQLYEAALDRMAREIAAVNKIDEESAIAKIDEVLSKSGRGARAASDSEEAQAAA